MVKRQRQVSHDGGIWRRECIESIVQYIPSPTAVSSFLEALPRDALGLPLQSLLTLLQSPCNHENLWPRFVLKPMAAVDANYLRLLRHSSELYPYVVVRGAWDLDVLSQCLSPTTPIHCVPEATNPRPIEWFHTLSTFHVTSLIMDDFYGGIDVPGSFLLTLERFSNLRRLELKCTTALTEFELDLLFASLSSCPIESLHFKQSPWELPPSCAARLGHWLLHSNRATELSLDACSVHRHDCANVVFAIASSPTLKHLRIVRGNLGRALSSAAHLPHRLHTLVLHNTHLTPTSMMHKIMWLSHLVELHLDGNPVRDRGVRRLVKALLASSRTGDIPLKVLGLANAGIGADGGADLASVLPLTYLTSLSVGRNAMGDSVGLTLAAVLPRCRHLSHLDVHRLALTDDGVVAIVSALPMCQSLEFVNLSENWTTFVGAVQLVTVLPQCAHVKFLSLAHNPLEARGVQVLMRVLPSHMRLNLTVDMEAADCRQCVELATTLGVADRVTLSTSAAGWRSSTATVGGSQLCVIGPT